MKKIIGALAASVALAAGLAAAPTANVASRPAVIADRGVAPAAASQSIAVTAAALTICANGAAIPPGYVVTSRSANSPSCGPNNSAGFNAYGISAIAAGDVMCWGTAFEPAEPVPAGYVVTAMLDTSACGTGVNAAGFNAYRISNISSS